MFLPLSLVFFGCVFVAFAEIDFHFNGELYLEKSSIAISKDVVLE